MQPVLFIHSGYRPFRNTLFKRLANLNIDFLFITHEKLFSPYGISLELKKVLKYKSLNLKGIKILNDSFGHSLDVTGVINLFLKLSKEIIKGSHKIIITATEHPLHSKIAFLWAKILKKRIIIWTESWHEMKYENFLMKIYHFAAKYVLKHADAILVHGTAQKNYCKKLGISENKLFLFNHCSNDLLSQNIKSDIKKELGIQNKKIILYIGRIIRLKGLDVLIKAFSRLEKNCGDSLFLLICGNGDFTQDCKSLAGELKVKNIKFMGTISPDDVPQFLYFSDLFVHPARAIKDQVEGWGLVINEAASAGKPIITTDAVGAAPDLVKNGWNGYIVKNGDIYDLYEAMFKIISDEKLMMEMGKNSRKIFEEFNDYDKAIKELKKAIDYVKV